MVYTQHVIVNSFYLFPHLIGETIAEQIDQYRQLQAWRRVPDLIISNQCSFSRVLPSPLPQPTH